MTEETETAPGDVVVRKLRELIAAKVDAARPGSPEHYRLRETLELPDDALVDYVFAHLEPNPDRVGCPSRTILIALAHRTRPLRDPWWDHIMTCAPCRIDVRALARVPLPEAPARSVWRRRGWAAAAVGAVAGVLVLRGLTTPSSPSPVSVLADLRAYAVRRSDQPPTIAPVVALPPQRVRLTVVLPTASEPGSYEVTVRSADGQSPVMAIGTATLQDFVTRLNVDLDLRAVPRGPYDLAVRQTGEEWRRFPIRVN